MDKVESEITILEKDGHIAAIGRQSYAGAAIGIPEGIVSTYDTRLQGNFARKAFDTDKDADANYRDAIRTSTNREWSISYRGGQLNDPATS
jgi:hypothetical protein